MVRMMTIIPHHKHHRRSQRPPTREAPHGGAGRPLIARFRRPNGYQASVSGGEVVSAPDAPELAIGSDGGTDTITVTLGPKAGSLI